MERLSLADAIREGSKTSAHVQFYFVRPRPASEPFAFEACALGAAAIGIGQPELGLDETEGTYFDLFTGVWPELGNEGVECPIPDCHHFICDLYSCITHLNDDHNWTREAIADWLDTITVQIPATVHQEASV